MKRVNRKNKGVSTIVAAALLVAMTVILGVALGATVLQTPEIQKPYQLQLQGWASKGANEITLTHLGGDPINTNAVVFYTYIPEGTSVYSGSRYELPTTAIKSHPNPSTGAFQAGDTLVLNYTACWPVGVWGSAYAPNVGEQFMVEVYKDGQPITAVTIVLQP